LDKPGTGTSQLHIPIFGFRAVDYVFAVAFIAAAALIYSIKVRRLTAENAALSSELALRDARAWLRQEQTILWPFDKDIEIVSAGFGSSLNIESSDDSQFFSFL
jgi:hypothetical protein